MKYKNEEITRDKNTGYYKATILKKGYYKPLMADTQKGIKKLIKEALKWTKTKNGNH